MASNQARRMHKRRYDGMADEKFRIKAIEWLADNPVDDRLFNNTKRRQEFEKFLQIDHLFLQTTIRGGTKNRRMIRLPENERIRTRSESTKNS